MFDVCRDKPYLLFFDIKQCATIVSISDLLAGDVDKNSIFTCPTQQVSLLCTYYNTLQVLY